MGIIGKIDLVPSLDIRLTSRSGFLSIPGKVYLSSMGAPPSDATHIPVVRSNVQLDKELSAIEVLTARAASLRFV